jgi:hypothetical protein
MAKVSMSLVMNNDNGYILGKEINFPTAQKTVRDILMKNQEP